MAVDGTWFAGEVAGLAGLEEGLGLGGFDQGFGENYLGGFLVSIFYSEEIYLFKLRRAGDGAGDCDLGWGGEAGGGGFGPLPGGRAVLVDQSPGFAFRGGGEFGQADDFLVTII